MKRYLIAAAAATLVSIICCVGAKGQGKIPLDPNVRMGKLSNGLTYYILHNSQQKQRADFYLAQQVGSILEEESQRGLAHFLEHMCFNGTKNFPGNSMVKDLEAKGIKFGENLNAYTAFDKTVYNLSSIDVQRSSLIDTALLVLHDWSGFVSLTDKDIDDERGVIREEWRSRNTGDSRVLEESFKQAYPNNITGSRMPIGLIDVINSFSYKELRDYYKKWYRPDLQAVIVVGDIDVNDVEARIKTLFSDIKEPLNPAKRKYVSVENNYEPIVAVATDPEVVKTMVSLVYKKDAVPFTDRNMESYYESGIIQSLISQMINGRYSDVAQQANPPFKGANSSYSSYFVSVTKDAWTTSAAANNGNALEALRAIVRENERMKRLGFSASELERAKSNMLRGYESAYSERNNQRNDTYVKRCIAHFTSNEPMPGIEFEYNLVKKDLSKLTVDMVNSIARSYVTDTNMVVLITGPQKESFKMPSKAEILKAIADIKGEKLAAYEDKMVGKSLLSAIPKGGKVVKTTSAPFGYTRWTLSNGVNVYLKKTNFKEEQVMMYAFSEGGSSVFDIKDRPNYSVINEVAPLGGFGEYSPLELGKVLSGKMAGISANVSGSATTVTGYTTSSDFETLMQLTYLKFTQPRKDDIAFRNYLLRKRNQLENAELNPASAFSDSVLATLYNHNPLAAKFDLKMLEKVSYDKVMNLNKQCFANAGNFSFIFTGAVNPDSVKHLVETYIGGLPASGKKDKWRDKGLRLAKGAKTVEFDKEQSVPKSKVFVSYSGTTKYTLENIVLMSYVSSILNLRYTERIREQEGGTYGVSVSGSIDKRPEKQYGLQIMFDTDPKQKGKLVDIVLDEVRLLVEKGPSAKDISNIKEFMLKKNKEKQTDNAYWQSLMAQYLNDNIDYYTNYISIVQSVTPDKIRKAAQEWFTQGNVIRVIMNSKSEK